MPYVKLSTKWHQVIILISRRNKKAAAVEVFHQMSSLLTPLDTACISPVVIQYDRRMPGSVDLRLELHR